MRRILVDYSRGHRAKKRGSGFEKVFLEEAAGVSKEKAADVIALDEALTRLAEFDPQQARLVELRFFGGLGIEDAAGVLGVSRTTVNRNWNLAKARLARELRRGGEKDACLVRQESPMHLTSPPESKDVPIAHVVAKKTKVLLDVLRMKCRFSLNRTRVAKHAASGCYATVLVDKPVVG